MMLRTLVAAALVWGGANLNASVSANALAGQAVIMADEQIPQYILEQLVELHAAPYWNLTTIQAWSEYEKGKLVFTTVIPGEVYLAAYAGGIITIIIDGE